jgi:D-sedoheptulose 7-phosphate isomerase
MSSYESSFAILSLSCALYPFFCNKRFMLVKHNAAPYNSAMIFSYPTTDYQALAREHARVVTQFFEHYDAQMHDLVGRVSAVFANQGCLFLCGNGGSACDAMHIAGEFVGRFKRERRGLPAMALSADAGIITAIANDYDFSRIFARQVEALGKQGDMLVALSTSGRSPSIIAALQEARDAGLTTVLFTGRKGADKAGLVDMCFVVDSEDTARIQECYMVALHALADGAEAAMMQ